MATEGTELAATWPLHEEESSRPLAATDVVGGAGLDPGPAAYHRNWLAHLFGGSASGYRTTSQQDDEVWESTDCCAWRHRVVLAAAAAIAVALVVAIAALGHQEAWRAIIARQAQEINVLKAALADCDGQPKVAAEAEACRRHRADCRGPTPPSAALMPNNGLLHIAPVFRVRDHREVRTRVLAAHKLAEIQPSEVEALGRIDVQIGADRSRADDWIDGFLQREPEWSIIGHQLDDPVTMLRLQDPAVISIRRWIKQHQNPKNCRSTNLYAERLECTMYWGALSTVATGIILKGWQMGGASLVLMDRWVIHPYVADMTRPYVGNISLVLTLEICDSSSHWQCVTRPYVGNV